MEADFAASWARLNRAAVVFLQICVELRLSIPIVLLDRMEDDMPHWRKANPSASKFNSILARCGFAVSMLILGTVLLLLHMSV